MGSPDQPLTVRLRKAAWRLRHQIITNAVLFAILAVAGYWWLYPLLWVTASMTWEPMIARFRAIGEHSMVTDNDDPYRNTRTTHANWIERALIAPYFVNYHIEHHLLLFVPCYTLPKVHDLLLEKGYGPKMELQPGYRAMLALAASNVTAPSWS
jgi:fatty acid desaturase